MDIINDAEFKRALRQSVLRVKYNQEIDRDSAYEKLTRKLEQAAKDQHIPVERKRTSSKSDPTLVETLSKNTMVRQMGTYTGQRTGKRPVGCSGGFPRDAGKLTPWYCTNFQ